MAANGTATAGGAPVAHHFDNLRQQHDAVRFGMWLFMMTEILFFAGVMCAYTAYRAWYPLEFEAGSAALNVGIATVNTFLLLASSLTITLGIRACYVGDQKGLKMWLLATIILGAAFLGLKAREYHLDYEEGLLPTPHKVKVAVTADDGSTWLQDRNAFDENVAKVLDEAGYDYKAKGVFLPRVQLFFIFYYSMTGLHVLHMVVGLGLLLWQYILAERGFFAYSQRYIYVEVMSLYWHFVDMVWIFLLPLLYLAGPHNTHQITHGLQQAFGMAH